MLQLFRTQARPEGIDVCPYVLRKAFVQLPDRALLMLISVTGKLQGKGKALVQRVLASELGRNEIFKIEQQGLALAKDIKIKPWHRAMLNFVP
jgi:hypothetical protein